MKRQHFKTFITKWGLRKCSEGKAIEIPNSTPKNKFPEVVLCALDFTFFFLLLFLFNIAADPCLPDLRNTFKALQNPTFLLSYKFAHCISQLKSLTLDSLIKSSQHV